MKGCATVGFLLFLLPFIVVIYFIIKLIVKAKNQGWTGTVMNKQHRVREDFDSDRKEDAYILTVNMSDGREHHIEVSGSFWNAIKIGDKIEKPKGELQPKKVQTRK